MSWMQKSLLLAATLHATWHAILPAQQLRPVQVASGLAATTDIQAAGDGSGRLFLVEQRGAIRILRAGALLPQFFLDIRSKVSTGGERGLLGLAFPPGFAQSQRFYVNYTDTRGDTVIAQYRLSTNPDQADPATEIVLLRVPQPFSNHNGGQLQFGPDGYLYIGMGDGGSGGDPQGNGQNLDTLLGKMLRVDVESTPGTLRIPPDNPFLAETSARPEIWARGLRNPWRFSFDRAAADLWIADVGQNIYEEINVQPAASRGGENYGWKIMEGRHCYDSSTCSTQGLTPPVIEYSHSLGCSVTGGYVYRGARFPGLWGNYLYGDYCSGVIWAARWNGAEYENRVFLESGFQLTTFGQDEAGEIYVNDTLTGRIYRLEPTPGSPLEQCSYSLNADGHSFPATAATASLEITTAANCAWDASSTAPWLTLDSLRAGAGNSTLQFTIAANSGPARSTTLRIAGLSYAMTQAAADLEPLPEAGTLPQIVSGGGWITTLGLLNLGASPTTARLQFLDPAGAPLSLPVTDPDSVAAIAPQLTPILERTLPPAGQALAETAGGPLLEGWGSLSGGASLRAYALIRHAQNQWEIMAPAETRAAATYFVPYDNTHSGLTALALANPTSQPGAVRIRLRDNSGALLLSDSIDLAPQSRLTFILPQRYPATESAYGLAEFDTPPGGRISLLGLRIQGNTATSLPVLANATTGGGALPHFAIHGGFTTSITLINTGADPADATLTFTGTAGQPLPLPFASPAAATLTRTLAPGASLVLAAAADAALPTLTGSAVLTTNGNVTGFVTIRWTELGRETAVPLETRNAASYVLPYDNLAGATTAIAVANLSPEPASVEVRLRDSAGAALPSSPLSLPARGQVSYALPAREAAAVGRRGSIEFVTPAGARIAVLGLRIQPDGTLAAIPVFVP
jgi:glucose/arabinose dehydrogenase